MVAACAAIALLTVRGEEAQKDPLHSVMGLLADLKAKITREGQDEAHAYKKYDKWCGDAQAAKSEDIESATTQKEKLEAKIEELSATEETASTKIDDLAAELSKEEKELDGATRVRNKEREDFDSNQKELEEVIETLDRSIQVLRKQSPASLVQLNTATAKGIVDAITAVSDAAALSIDEHSQLLGLVQAQHAHQADSDDEELGAPKAAAYESHSSGIFDMLEDLKDKAEGQLSDIRKAERSAMANFETLAQGLKDEMNQDNKNLDAAKHTKASASESKATAKGDLDVTIKDLQSAKAAKESIIETCQQTDKDHAATVEARSKELKAIDKAVETLDESTGDSAKKSFFFLEVQSRRTPQKPKVVVMVKQLADKYRSAALAQLASRMSAEIRFGGQSGDPFKKVRDLIKSLISKLENEAASEATEKAYCDAEMKKTTSKKEDLQDDVSSITAKLDQAVSRTAQLKEEVRELQGQLAEVAKEQADMDTIREEQHKDYLEAKDELENGLQGVRRALGVLREYYNSKDEEAAAAMVQESDSDGESMMESAPPPPKTFKKSSGAGGGIISMLEVCESDFADNLAKEEMEETTAQESYSKTTQENKATVAVKAEDVHYKTREYKSLDKSINEFEADRSAYDQELSAVLEYDAKLKERCVGKPDTYAERKAQRDAEIKGLKEALKTLEGEESLLQRSRHRTRRVHTGQLSLGFEQ